MDKCTRSNLRLALEKELQDLGGERVDVAAEGRRAEAGIESIDYDECFADVSCFIESGGGGNVFSKLANDENLKKFRKWVARSKVTATRRYYNIVKL